VLGPLYLQYVDLLLQKATALEATATGLDSAAYTSYLQQVRTTVEQFKTSELRDYFGDACVDAARPKTTALERVSLDAGILYPILLEDRTELLLSLSTGIKRVQINEPSERLERRTQIFRIALQAQDAQRYLYHAQQLYDLLIRPIEADLRAGQTLVWVPDGALRLLPLAALHDGKQFLIEKYALAVTPSLTLTDPRPLPQEAVSALAAGVSESVANFPPLPHVRDELQGIQQLYGGTVLLNQDFSPTSLAQTVDQGQFSIVHIASHGEFAADPAKSFLLTSQGKLTLTQLAKTIGQLRFRDQPLELLTLSACETAQGDDRTALGLAGVAIQAGARSAVATLWRVSDEATAVLMQRFYEHLRAPGTSRAQALQQAQLSLLHDPNYASPVYWSPFLLINNWL
jgi:CHAT domain-containing protein